MVLVAALTVEIAGPDGVQAAKRLFLYTEILRVGNHYIVEMELPERQCVVGTLVPRVFIYGIVQDGISGMLSVSAWKK